MMSNWALLFFCWLNILDTTALETLNPTTPLPDVRQYRKKIVYIDPFAKIEEKVPVKPPDPVLPKENVPQRLEVNIMIPDVVQRQMEAYLRREDVKQAVGFRVQIFSGDGSSASNMRFDFLEMYPEVDVYTFYDKPFFKVRVGNFGVRKDADAFCSEIKPYFPAAFVVPEQIIIKSK